MPSFVERLTRRKYVQLEYSELERILGTVDLTALGIGSTIGVGIYVLAGQVARTVAGPSVSICFLIAAIASLFAGLCYAEFGARVPKAGSAYVYAYVCVGEFVAFVIGWNLILEYVIGTASVASGFSLYIDKIFNNTMSDALKESLPMHSDFLGEYPDFLACGLALVIAALLMFGVKESSRFNNVCTGINMVVVVFVIISAATQADGDNWHLSEEDINNTCPRDTDQDWGTGGFAPYGFAGIMQGAATCFFGFVGFDVIATTGEEAINPGRTVPLSIAVSLLVVFLSYFGISSVITLVVPYCLQDDQAPLVYVYEYLNWDVAMWFVTVGALFGFSASLFGALFPLPRVIYAMASDGLIFRFLGKISKRFHTPTLATLIAGLFAGFMALIFNLESLVNMMSIGTLMAYTIVALCVILLRYSEEGEEPASLGEQGKSPAVGGQTSHSASDYLRQAFNPRGLREPNHLTSSLCTYATLSFFVVVSVLALLLVVLMEELGEGAAGAITLVVVMALVSFTNLLVLAKQPQSNKKLNFKVPLVPWIPALSTLINMYLMCNLPSDTWIRFAVWMVAGLLLYFGYGMANSSGADPLSPANRGYDNQGYEGDNARKHLKLVIPTIEIQPATPLSSQPGTPKLAPKKAAPLKKSPLVTVEVHKEEGLGKAVQEGKKEELVKEEVVGQGAGDSGNQSDGKQPNMMKLVALLAEMKKAEAKDEDEDKQDEENQNKENEEKVNVEEKELAKTEDKPETEENIEDGEAEVKQPEDSTIQEAEQDPNNADPEGVVAERQQGVSEKVDPVLAGSVVVAAVASDTRKDSGTQHTVEGGEQLRQDAVDGLQGHEEQGTQPVDRPDAAEDSRDKDSSNTRQKINLVLNIGATKVDTAEDSPPSLRMSHSVPTFPSSPTPPPPPPSSPFSQDGGPPPMRRPLSDDVLYRSVPSTPVSRRHPHKVLRRMSSFDDIPPSSPNSPSARHVGNKFVIIPVREPGLDSDDDISLASQVSVPASPGLEPRTDQEALFLELQSKLSQADEGGSSKNKSVFTFGSSDSLDNVASEPDPPSRKRLTKRESKLELLDPIRERGESKIIHDEEDKPNVASEPQKFYLPNELESVSQTEQQSATSP